MGPTMLKWLPPRAPAHRPDQTAVMHPMAGVASAAMPRDIESGRFTCERPASEHCNVLRRVYFYSTRATVIPEGRFTRTSLCIGVPFICSTLSCTHFLHSLPEP